LFLFNVNVIDNLFSNENRSFKINCSSTQNAYEDSGRITLTTRTLDNSQYYSSIKYLDFEIHFKQNFYHCHNDRSWTIDITAWTNSRFCFLVSGLTLDNLWQAENLWSQPSFNYSWITEEKVCSFDTQWNP
jgi:hypothetical protein